MVRNLRSPVLFLHIGWAREYLGGRQDLPQGSFGFIKEGQGRPGETVNFKNFRGRCYGYAPHAAIDLARLGGKLQDEHVNRVLVVFTATNPDGSGRYIVGWYKDARVYAKRRADRPDRFRPDYLVEADAANAHLVPVDERMFFIPSLQLGWPGVSSAFYASATLDEERLAEIQAYVGGSSSIGFVDETSPSGRGGAGHCNDPELKFKIERTAMAVVRAHYEACGFELSSVETDNVGWDLEASRGKRVLLVEVKGRGGDGPVELTPNEYSAMTAPRTRMRYRLAVVHQALSASPQLTLFQFTPGTELWESDSGERLEIAERTGARMSF